MDQPNSNTEEMWAKDPKNYKWGIYYYNKGDKRFWIKNWNGIYRGRGWIINFARPNAILFFIVLIIAILAVIIAIGYSIS